MITKEEMQRLTRLTKTTLMEMERMAAEKWLDSNMEEDFRRAATSGRSNIVFSVPGHIGVEGVRKVLGERGFRVELVNQDSIYYNHKLPEPQIVCHWFW